MSDEIVSYEQLLQSLLITNKAYKELKAENERLRIDNERHKELNRKLANHNADYNDENVRLRENIEILIEERDVADKENDKFREALEFIADSRNDADPSRAARQALGEK